MLLVDETKGEVHYFDVENWCLLKCKLSQSLKHFLFHQTHLFDENGLSA